MEIFLAKFLGIYFFFIGLALLAHPSRFRKIYKDFFDHDGLIFMGALLALLLGALIVSVHNVWVLNWPVFITIVGWWGVVKGAGLLVFPEMAQKFRSVQNWSDGTYRMMGLVWMVVGAALSYVGWMPSLPL